MSTRLRVPRCRARVLVPTSCMLAVGALAPAGVSSQDAALVWDRSDPRPTLAPGWMDASCRVAAGPLLAFTTRRMGTLD